MKHFWKNKHVLVTGASGFIGQNAVRILIEKQSFVTAIVSSRTTQKKIKELFSSYPANQLTVKKIDLSSYKKCLAICKDQDIILHFAALDGGTSFKQKYPAQIFHTNTTLTLNMLKAALEANADRFLLMSSIEVYPKKSRKLIREEDAFLDEPNEKSVGYAWAKRVGEITAAMYYKEYGMKIAIARPGNVYGIGDNPQKNRVIPTFINKVLNGEDIILVGNPKLSFIHINDLIPGLLKLVEKYPTCDPVNIAGKRYISLHELAKMIVSFANSSSKVVKQGLLKQNTLARIINIEKAEKVIGFKEKITIEEGLQKLIKQAKQTI